MLCMSDFHETTPECRLCSEKKAINNSYNWRRWKIPHNHWFPFEAAPFCRRRAKMLCWSNKKWTNFGIVSRLWQMKACKFLIYGDKIIIGGFIDMSRLYKISLHVMTFRCFDLWWGWIAQSSQRFHDNFVTISTAPMTNPDKLESDETNELRVGQCELQQFIIYFMFNVMNSFVNNIFTIQLRFRLTTR